MVDVRRELINAFLPGDHFAFCLLKQLLTFRISILTVGYVVAEQRCCTRPRDFEPPRDAFLLCLSVGNAFKMDCSTRQ